MKKAFADAVIAVATLWALAVILFALIVRASTL